MNSGELLDRLVDRYAADLDEGSRRRLEYRIEQDGVVQLIGFINVGQ
ncbi:hypothetical protein [Rhodococcus sp. NPDC049939]